MTGKHLLYVFASADWVSPSLRISFMRAGTLAVFIMLWGELYWYSVMTTQGLTG